MNINHRESPFRPIGLALLSACLLISLTANSAPARNANKAVVEAVQERICFESFWWNRETFRLGKTVPISIRKDGGVTYVWTEGLSVVPGASRWANFFSVFTKGNESVVGSSYGYNLDIVQSTPDFKMKQSQVFGGNVEVFQLRVPSDCTPHFRSESPRKERVLRAVGVTIAKELMLFRRTGGTSYPNDITIVVARFESNYPETQVFIPSTGEVFHVALQDASNPLSDAFLEEGVYPIQPEYDERAINLMREKILKYGVARKIKLEAD
jgi:hypothetical protein